jgi:subtilase family serine protease
MSVVGSHDLARHWKRDVVPPDFEADDQMDKHQPLRFHIALAHNNITGLKALLEEVSFPDSPRYGQYLSNEQVRSLMSLIKEALI